MKVVSVVGFILFAGMLCHAQSSSEPFPPVGTMRQLMFDLIHPAANDLLLSIYRGGPSNAKEWAAARRNALTLAESGNLLMLPGRAKDQGEWVKDAKMMVAAGDAAYKSTLAKDAKGLAAVANPLDASCTNCHKEFRPDVFPRKGSN
jgi:cytochrome c556